MGFDRNMAKNLLVYDKDIIKDDWSKAVELLCKTETGWLHTFVPDVEDRPASMQKITSSEELNLLQNQSMTFTKECCLICGESRSEHRRNPFETRNTFKSQEKMGKDYSLFWVIIFNAYV